MRPLSGLMLISIARKKRNRKKLWNGVFYTGEYVDRVSINETQRMILAERSDTYWISNLRYVSLGSLNFSGVLRLLSVDRIIRL